MELLDTLNGIVGILFMLCYSYQIVYVIVVLVRKPLRLPDAPKHRFAVLISARNEQAVIANLIQSIRNQNYPGELVDTYVVADNCTDRTAAVARAAGAVVWERFNKQNVGKGYALKFLYEKIRAAFPEKRYDGYFVFDADNLLDENYILEMNKVFGAGHRIVTSYRNSKNCGSNWISAGYALWFQRESKFLNNARMLLGTSCAVSGTGFLVHHEIMERNHGWKHFLLTEDIEFTIDSVIQGERIAYCGSAIVYDEQPVTLRQSCRQRMRWAKGYFQVFFNYGGQLFRSIAKNGFSGIDLTLTIFPVILFTLAVGVVNIGVALFNLLLPGGGFGLWLMSLLKAALFAYGTLFCMGLLTTVTEWKQIHCKNYKKILYCFTFPLFLATYVPISIVALFKKVEWKPIHHSVNTSLQDIRSA